MRTLMNSCKNNIVMIVTVLSVLICSCFVIHFESDSELFHNEPAAKENYCSTHEVCEIPEMETPSLSSSQNAFIRQLSYKKGIGRNFGNDMIGILLTLPILLILYASLNICTYSFRSKCGLVVDYIHKKDGKKS